jgi:hypothetical protein
VIRALVAALVGVLVPAVAEAQSQPAVAPKDSLNGVYERGVVEVEPSVAPIESIEIENDLGDVRIEGHDGDSVIIHAFKRAPDTETLERLKVSLIPDPNGVVRIGSRVATDGEVKKIAAGTVRIDLVIQAPRGARVEGRVWNGALSVLGMENGAELSANEGDIDIESSSGRFVTNSALGRQRIKEVVGEVDARGLMGELAMEVVRGRRLAARLHEGKVVARDVRSVDVSIHVTKGNVTFEGSPQLGGHWSIVTYRGNIEVSFSKRAPFRIAARARRGTVKLPSQLQPARADGSGWIRGKHAEATTAGEIQLAAAIGNIAVNW